MGNIKSRKLKINQSEQNGEDSKNERINAIKSDMAEATTVKGKNEESGNNDLEQNKDKEHDNASSASTVEVLDDNNAAARSKNKKMPEQPIKLYYLPPSPPCRSVMMTAEALGIQLDLISTNVMNGDHLTPEFLKMNPQHTIPTMDDNGFFLWESRAIMAYLVNAYGKDDSLYPKNPRLRAIVDQRLNFDLGTFFSRYLDLYMPILFHGEAYDETKAEKLNEAFGWLNTFLDGHDFVAGENLTIADISIIVTVTNLEVFGYDYSAHENVKNWFERTKKALEPYGYEEIDKAGADILASFLKKE